jgi:hypothetical protein
LNDGSKDNFREVTYERSNARSHKDQQIYQFDPVHKRIACLRL